MRVLVTGGAGFIGANLVGALRHFAEIVVLDDLSSGRRSNLDGLGAEFVEGDLRDPATLDACMVGADAVVHLGAIGSVPRSVEQPLATHDVNVNGTVAVLEAARRIAAEVGQAPHVIFASSSSVYGDNPTLPKHEDLAPMPRSPYAASKLAGEAYMLSYAAVYGMDVLAFRFFNVFGPLQPAGHVYAAVIPAFVDAAVADRSLTVHGDGGQTRDFTYVGTVVETIGDAIRRRVTCEGPVNLAFGTRLSLLDVIDQLGTALGQRPAVTHTAARAGDVRDSQADQRRLESLFPHLSPVPFPEGLAATLAWFQSKQMA